MCKNERNCDAESIEEYIAVGGYQALAKVMGSMSPQEVIDEEQYRLEVCLS